MFSSRPVELSRHGTDQETNRDQSSTRSISRAQSTPGRPIYQDIYTYYIYTYIYYIVYTIKQASRLHQCLAGDLLVGVVFFSFLPCPEVHIPVPNSISLLTCCWKPKIPKKTIISNTNVVLILTQLNSSTAALASTAAVANNQHLAVSTQQTIAATQPAYYITKQVQYT